MPVLQEGVEVVTFLRELLCQQCGRDYPVWFAPNELWNAAIRVGEHFLCPTCFALLAEQREAVGPHAIWRLEVEK